MQKVVGSSPIIRSIESPAPAGFFVFPTLQARAAARVVVTPEVTGPRQGVLT